MKNINTIGVCSKLSRGYGISCCGLTEKSKIVIDSRCVKEGDVFLALIGSQVDGREFISAAIEKGAKLIMSEANMDNVYYVHDIPVLEVSDIKEKLGFALLESSSIDLDDYNLVGVTGTNGKTSVSHYIAQIIDSLNSTAAVIGTIGIGRIGDLSPATHTTPDIITLYNNFDQLYQKGCNYQVMEVSSHALHQQRVAAAPFKVSVFTNLTRDHLDYHKTMENYGNAKLELFVNEKVQSKVINIDDQFSKTIIEHHKCGTMLTYSLDNSSADLFCEKILPNEHGFNVSINGKWGRKDFFIPLLGRFNISNLLASIGAVLSLGFNLDDIIRHISKIHPVSGRMQILAYSNTPTIIVDYAHTPDALENALKSIHDHVPISGMVWCIFGCGGDRDEGKRPVMGKVASNLADKVVLTVDNPRFERPGNIIDDIKSGISGNSFFAYEDRGEAILKTIEYASSNDIILIAGKGHETYQDIEGVRYDFNDVSVAIEGLKKYHLI